MPRSLAQQEADREIRMKRIDRSVHFAGWYERERWKLGSVQLPYGERRPATPEDYVWYRKNYPARGMSLNVSSTNVFMRDR